MHSILPTLSAVRDASASLRRLTDSQRKALLHTLADHLLAAENTILAANQQDLNRMADGDPRKDRLMLSPERIRDLSSSLASIAELPDPTGQVLSEKTLSNGLLVQKTSVPLGVVGIIYESRPNVTIDVAALCLRTGNAVVLRGGSDAAASNAALVAVIHEAMQAHGLDPQGVALLPADRELVQELLTAEQYVDILIPRGSQALIDFVRREATVPTIETGAGVCHTYVAGSADLDKAAQIVVNAKVSRPSVCNALDTILVDQSVAKAFIPRILPGLAEYQVEIFADAEAFSMLEAAGYPHRQPAQPADFGREFLDYKCSLKLVEGPDEALAHIRQYSSRHSEAIVSEDATLCERFLAEVDAAAVYANASTRFTDGGVFGLGAEIGISTQKLHARGPFALEKLVTEKWVIRGDGQVR
ncbi:MAG: glutamate-5-semialdehyde dehydrogenase [Bacteroidetes bacterium]|nr:MAG: glutamate-5-semialdehyde dehydrogenase [Bacteroidota bacterium]